MKTTNKVWTVLCVYAAGKKTVERVEKYDYLIRRGKTMAVISQKRDEGGEWRVLLYRNIRGRWILDGDAWYFQSRRGAKAQAEVELSAIESQVG